VISGPIPSPGKTSNRITNLRNGLQASRGDVANLQLFRAP
jgi:hypothetical protein